MRRSPFLKKIIAYFRSHPVVALLGPQVTKSMHSVLKDLPIAHLHLSWRSRLPPYREGVSAWTPHIPIPKWKHPVNAVTLWIGSCIVSEIRGMTER